jgi:hypothetical protein
MVVSAAPLGWRGLALEATVPVRTYRYGLSPVCLEPGTVGSYGIIILPSKVYQPLPISTEQN